MDYELSIMNWGVGEWGVGIMNYELSIIERFFGLCDAMDWGYKGWNPYVERHLAIFVNCFLSIANSSIKSLTRDGFSQFMPPYQTITSNEDP